MKGFSDTALNNDEVLHRLRTTESRRLEQYFEKLERDIQEKLRQEAEKFKE